MPLAMTLSPSGTEIVVLLNGWREQGVQLVDRASGRILQTEEELFNHILWRTIKGNAVPYPGTRRIPLLELARTR